MSEETLAYRILVVDDEPAVGRAVARTLRSDGYDITVCEDPVQALEMVKTREFDMVISDHMMPGLKGIDLMRHVKILKPDVIRIVVTGRADVDMAIQAVNESDVHRLLTKPWDDHELRLSVRILRQHQATERENRRLLSEIKAYRAVLDRLEQKHPGIAEVKRDARGAIVVEFDK